jgi:histidine triad (HIT) family protein
VRGVENEHNSIKQTDIVYQNNQVTSFIGIRKWPNNVGHVLIIPNEHFENIYDLPVEISAEIQKTARAIALAMKDVYSCDGIMLLQRNEPAGEQRAWHYHLHVIPRYENDDWHLSQRQPFPADERMECALRLRAKIETDLLFTNSQEQGKMSHAPAKHWNNKFSKFQQAGMDFDWGSKSKDFILQYDWCAGSMPPPYHHEYTIRIGLGLQGEIVFYPDYPGQNTPVWTEPFEVSEEALDELYALVEERMLNREWMKVEDGAVGGSLEWMSGTVDGKSFRVPSRVEEPEALEPVYDAVKALVPDAIWAKLRAQREQYERDYEEV